MALMQEKQLAQSRPSGTSAVALYSPPASKTTIIKALMICNTTGSDAHFSIYMDDDGSTYDASTAIFFTVLVKANNTVEWEGYLPMNNSAGHLAVQSDTGNALTFTAFGVEIG